ncbi:hypothetical protein LWI28_014140 [Acer negundo]|uniref:RNase H type-1 domain-containing protein n=1 Tax=Acer negundo TaxID=4023 RepID=A0AAD5NS36_ACENE|nr:hypothetical protein LWI28_014140 [Acer negundo]
MLNFKKSRFLAGGMAQSGVVIGKPSGNCQTSSSSSDDSSFSDDSSSNDDFGKENQLIRSGPIFVRDGSGGPVRMRRGMDLLKDLEAKFVKVIEESITRGVNLRVANPAYDEDVGWCVEEEVAKVLETEMALGIQFNGNSDVLRKEIIFRDKEDRRRFQEIWIGWGSNFPMEDSFLAKACVNIRRRATKWCPPFGLKFNVDGFLRGNQGPTSIGGILRNHDGDTICMFSSFLGDGLSSSVAEMSAILKVCEMCEFDNCPDMLSITIESYCKCVVRWVNGVRVVDNVRNLDNILEIREFLHRNALRVLVKFVPRSSKVVADILAKLGALSGLDQVVWRS